MHNNSHPSPAANGRLRILIADDCSDDAEIIRLAFHEAAVPAELKFVSSGDELLHYFQKQGNSAAKHPVELPNLMLLDLKMPGLDGFQVLEWLRSHPPLGSIPVIVFSASDQPVDINRALSLGAVRYLVKPHKMSDMVQMVRGIEKFWQKLQADSTPGKCLRG